MPTRTLPSLRARTLATLITLAAATMLIAACGTDEETSDYVDRVNEVQRELLGTFSTIASDAAGLSDPNEIGQAMGQMQDGIETAANRLAGLEPPSEVADDHDELVEAIRGLGEPLAEARQAVRDAAGAGTVEELEASLEAIEVLSEVIDEGGSRADQIIGRIADELGVGTEPAAGS